VDAGDQRRNPEARAAADREEMQRRPGEELAQEGPSKQPQRARRREVAGGPDDQRAVARRRPGGPAGGERELRRRGERACWPSASAPRCLRHGPCKAKAVPERALPSGAAALKQPPAPATIGAENVKIVTPGGTGDFAG